MRRPMTARRSAPDRGVTLIEVVVAVLVLSIATIAAFRSIDHARRSIGGETARLFAGEVALNRAAELQLEGARAGRALPGEVRYGPVLWQIATQEEITSSGLIRIAITVSAPDTPGAQRVVFVPTGDAE